MNQSEMEEIFGPVISVYSTEQAVEDGYLHHPYPERWPWLLITENVAQACESDPNRSFDQACVPLLMDCIMQAQAKKLGPDNDLAELEHTVAGTVWIRPNEKGGMTVMQPSEN